MNQPDSNSLPLWRLNLLRGLYAFMAIGLTLVVWPGLLTHSDRWAADYGAQHALLSMIGVLAWLGIRYPQKMLPLLVFELGWKVLWWLFIGLPLLSHGKLEGEALQSAWEIGLGLIIIPPVLPWAYLYQQYLRQPAERWR
ncbi:hypothetical protein C7S18_08760 [Ahniella affigens]|uniref:Uncharacterized protein n=1 Tax=Ahniella affigens TaxID=2021234 RepID=A0A2P1PQZ9_9GAMM|nr:hypothetical protein [Ahniella affigens]AVP97277.1 hypothetical protein C7S18_08760 [Ahniella affigens]